MSKRADVKGMDVPIVKLVPLRKRTVSPKSYARLLANLKAVGLIQPLCICRDGDQLVILDGYIRYLALLELGVQTVPCLVLDSKDIYTANRQVNHLSPQQESKMLRKALEHLDEKTIAQAFGIESIGSRLGMGMRKDLHPEVFAAVEAGRLQRKVAREFTHVLQKRQLEILTLMKHSNDWSVAFVRAQVLRTSAALRGKAKENRATPWEQFEANKRNLVGKLQEVEKHHDFYSGLYRQYSSDLLKISIYVRLFLNRPPIREYLAAHHAEALALFESVVKESETKVA